MQRTSLCHTSITLIIRNQSGLAFTFHNCACHQASAIVVVMPSMFFFFCLELPPKQLFPEVGKSKKQIFGNAVGNITMRKSKNYGVIVQSMITGENPEKQAHH